MPAPGYAPPDARLIIDYDGGSGSRRLTSANFLGHDGPWSIKRPTRDSGRLTVRVQMLDDRGSMISTASMTNALARQTDSLFLISGRVETGITLLC